METYQIQIDMGIVHKKNLSEEFDRVKAFKSYQ